MMLPTRARACAQYDPAQRQLHAVDWHGSAVVYDTPAELLHALAEGRVYAQSVVHAAALWFAADHGVPWELPPFAPAPLLRLQQRSVTEGYSLSALQRCLQAFDRAYEQTCQLVVPMLDASDFVCVVDRDGLLAQTLVRAATSAAARISPTRGAAPDADATVVLVHTRINRSGCIADPADRDAVAATQAAGISRYGLAPFGPVECAGLLPDDALHAIVTGRGLYRPDRVTRYDDDSDYGPDIISLT